MLLLKFVETECEHIVGLFNSTDSVKNFLGKIPAFQWYMETKDGAFGKFQISALSDLTKVPYVKKHFR